MSDPSLIHEFLAESRENLDQLDRDLIVLEKDSGNRERLASVFRTVHTIKGTCGFLGFGNLESLTHAGENLLARLRDGRLCWNGAIAGALLALVDLIREMLVSIESTGREDRIDCTRLVQTLAALADPPEPGPTDVRPKEAERCLTGEPPIRAAAALSETSIRVDVGLLDKLVNLAGELVLARNRILQCTEARNNPAFQSASQRLNLITTELQEGVMKTRMQPIANIWNKFPRVVRDLAVARGKQVRIDMEGKETDLDRTIIEAIKDPLTHLVRNAVDHGIEMPDVRRSRGKPVEGRILLRAFHEGGQVNIEIADDGSGIDTERIAHKALERGLLSQAQLLPLTERQLCQLVFLPGLSTASEVTRVSGRGVGMDVVKTNIEKVGGAVDLHSQPGQGTSVKIKIPLTLTIVPALIVTSAGQRYAIPQSSLLEVLRLDRNGERGIESISGCPVYRLQDKLVPLVCLNQLLGLAEQPAGAATVVVLQADGQSFGLVVDGVLDTEEIVVKPLGRVLRGIPVFAGATVLGDGRVTLILDVSGIAHSAGVVAAAQEQAPAPKEDDPSNGRQPHEALVLVQAGSNRQLAVPASRVIRLEEISPEAVEKTGRQAVVQYGGSILPLLHLAEILESGPVVRASQQPMQVVVCSNDEQWVGLVVHRIVDVVEMPVQWQRRQTQPGILGSAVIRQRVTDLLDVPAIMEANATECALESPA